LAPVLAHQPKFSYECLAQVWPKSLAKQTNYLNFRSRDLIAERRVRPGCRRVTRIRIVAVSITSFILRNLNKGCAVPKIIAEPSNCRQLCVIWIDVSKTESGRFF